MTLLEELNKPLDESRVKKFGSNAGAKKGLSFLEGHDVIRELNKVFDFGWSHDIEPEFVFERETKNSRGEDQILVSYKCLCTISIPFKMDTERTFATHITHQGIGWGSSQMSPYRLADAHEVAIKEAETDSIKRAAMKFGDRFGLALYDKEQKNVTKPYDGAAEAVKLLADAVSHFGEQAPAVAAIKDAIVSVAGAATEFKVLTPEQAKAVRNLVLKENK